MTKLSRARRKLRRLHAAHPRTPRPPRLRHRIARLLTHIRYLRRLHFDGLPHNVTHRLFPIIVLAHRHGLRLTATTNGTHTSSSYHYPWNNADGLGHAIDVSGARGAMIRFQRAVLHKYGRRHFLELFGPDDFYVQGGARYTGHFPGHSDHVHVAV